MTRRFTSVVALATALFFGFSPIVAGAHLRHHGDRPTSHRLKKSVHRASTSQSCPRDATCAHIPGNSTVSGGTIEIEPTKQLGSNQWVYIHGDGFTANTYLRVDYCSNIDPTPALDPCVISTNAEILQATVIEQTLADGTFYFSYQVVQATTPTQAISGGLLGDPQTVKKSFLCDTTTPCAIQVTSLGSGEGSRIASASNTTVIPIQFNSVAASCGTTASKVTTESEFGIEFVLTKLDQSTCSSTSPTLAFNTAIDSYSALEALTAANTQVAFVDDPASSNMEDLLSQGNYKLIPVALSANVVGFRATTSHNQNPFPLNTISLTPTMVAGLLLGLYTGSSHSDLVTCSGTHCPIPPCLPHTKRTHKHGPQCALITLVNYQTGFLAPQQSDGFARSDEAGSTGLLFQWLCQAPVVGVRVSLSNGLTTLTQTFTESQTAAQVLEHAFSSPTKKLNTCPTIDQYQALPTGAYGKYAAYNDPDQQSIKMENLILSGGRSPIAAYTTMNWAEALYYGLSIAKLQNADGEFVAPSMTSLQLTVKKGVQSPDGAIVTNYQTAQSGTYPMTSIIYAAVCADPTTTSSARSEATLLTQLLQITGGGTNANLLPRGFAPLPSTVVQTAHKEISADIVGGGKSQKTITTVAQSCPLGASSSSSDSTGSGGSSTNKGASTKTLKFVPSSLRTQPTTHGGKNTGRTSPLAPARLVVAGGNAAGSTIPTLLLAGLIAAVVGGAVGLSADIRRRVAGLFTFGRSIVVTVWTNPSLRTRMRSVVSEKRPLGRKARRTW